MLALKYHPEPGSHFEEGNPMEPAAAPSTGAADTGDITEEEDFVPSDAEEGGTSNALA